MRVRGAVVLVTGASSGIGAATARLCAARGARVVLAARRAAALAALAESIRAAGGQALAVPTDLGQRAAVEALVDAAVAQYGRVDVLVNNAGVGGDPALLGQADAALEQMLATNLLAPARCVQAVVPHMRRQGGGVIVNIGSVAGEVATPGFYAATKFGLRGLSDALRRELRGDRIAVVLVAPGFIRTPMTAGVRVPMPGPETVARAVLRAIERPRRRVVVPRSYAALVCLAKALPWLADLVLSRGVRLYRRPPPAE